MRNVTIVSSSMRKGNSDALCNEFQKGASENNRVERINLRDNNIVFCKGCSLCQETGKCNVKDDMKKIIDIIRKTDVLVLATPIYFGEISGQLKTFLDRLYPLYGSMNIEEVYVIASCYRDDKNHIDGSLNSIRRFFKDMCNIQIKDIIYGENCDDIGSVSEKQKEFAYKKGQLV